MAVTLRGLAEADVGRLRAVAGHWDRLVADIDATVEDLVRDTRDLPSHWHGDGAEAATARNADLQVRIGNAHEYCSAIAAAARSFADEIDQCRRLLLTLVAEAEALGIEVDLDRVEGSPYFAQFQVVLARADEADRRATDAVNANRIRDTEVPGNELQPYTTDTLAVAWVQPADRAAYWYWLHPVNKERAITEQPELVGPAVGLPTAVRDRANRILLGRAKDGLVARCTRLNAMHEGAGGRAVADADAGLAEIARVERRLAEPGARLLSYPPAVIGGADPRWDDFVPPPTR